MRVYLYDAHEFDSPSSEEMLHIVIAHKKECPSAQSFLEKSRTERFRWLQHDAGGTAKAKRRRQHTQAMQMHSPINEYDPVPLQQHRYFKRLREHAERFNCFPEPLENFTVVAETHTPPTAPSRMELLLETQRRFIWYKWDSTA